MSDLDSGKVTTIIYNALEKCLNPDALSSFIRRGQKAKGSQSVHGFMKLLAQEHESRGRSLKNEQTHA